MSGPASRPSPGRAALTLGGAALAGLLQGGCPGPEGETPAPAALLPGEDGGFGAKVVVVTTDYQSGSYAVLDLDLGEAAGDLAPVHPDAVGRMEGGIPLILARRGGDSALLLDPDALFAPDHELSVGNGANPHDAILVGEDELWVSLYDRPALAIFSLSTGEALGSVDLSPFADGDGLPEAATLAQVGDVVWVAVQRLDRDAGYAPVGEGMLAVVDVATRALVDVDPGTPALDGIPLGFPNPVDLLLRLPDGRVAVLTQGAYTTTGDGGIEILATSPPYAREVIATEAALGGSVTYFATGDGETFFVVVNEPLTPGTLDVATALKAVRPGGEIVEILRTPGYDLGDIAVTGRGELLVCDRRAGATGVRVFDAETFAPLTADPIPVGLAPFFLLPFDAPTEDGAAGAGG